MSDHRIELVPLGAALSAALVAIYVVCAIGALILPGLPLAHGWLALFGGYPPLTLSGAVFGILASAVVGWLAALVFAPVYNATLRNEAGRRPLR